MSNYRIENKENVHFNGRKTSYKIFELDGGAYLYCGSGFAKGWDASDSECVMDFNANNEEYLND